jgi:hypothetical protein
MRVFNTFLMLVMAFLGISLSSAMIPFIARMMGRSNRGTSTPSDPSDYSLSLTAWRPSGSAIPPLARMGVSHLAPSKRDAMSLAANVSPGGSTATGTHSKSGSRNSHASEANFAGVGENGMCCLADGIEAHGEALAKGLEAQGEALAKGLEAQGKAQGEALAKGIEGGMKYIACSIAFSSVAICIAFR